MYFSRPAVPSFSIFAGVSNCSNSTALAWFTDLSVAWADSTTATSSSYGVRYLSSVVGFGFAAWKRRKISRRFSAFIAFCAPAPRRSLRGDFLPVKRTPAARGAACGALRVVSPPPCGRRSRRLLPGSCRCNRRGREAGTARSRCTRARPRCASVDARRRSRPPGRPRCSACSRCSGSRRSGQRWCASQRREWAPSIARQLLVRPLPSPHLNASKEIHVHPVSQKHLYERRYGSFESEARCPRAGRVHVRHAIVHHAFLDVDRIAVRRRPRGLRDPALVDADVDQRRAAAHVPEHVAGDERRRHLAWRQDPADDEIRLRDDGPSGLERHAWETFSQSGKSFFGPGKDANFGSHAVRERERIRADVARAEDHQLACRHALQPGKQDTAAAVLLLQAPCAGLHREPAGDGRHRGEDRQAAAGLADRFEGDESRARGERGVEQPGMRREVLKTEDGLPATGAPVLRFLELLDLDHQLAFPRSAQFRAPGDVILVREADRFARPGFDDDLAIKRTRSGRRERDAKFAVLYFPRNADTHSGTSSGPR